MRIFPVDDIMQHNWKDKTSSMLIYWNYISLFIIHQYLTIVSGHSMSLKISFALSNIKNHLLNCYDEQFLITINRHVDTLYAY